MRNTWPSPRSAIWEYWTSLIACLFWIQYSCGMPHVIRIGAAQGNIVVLCDLHALCLGCSIFYGQHVESPAIFSHTLPPGNLTF
ncbi:hypothetical protein GOODEAATRI_006359 [Goodea atripinnis]|uniref:Secreted protein n=1 Tax=Goodea atripinnis TaxID=208336 RepID=A0ABV0PLE8_9TELE